MRNLILHIGRHKTGTTAIQRFLCGNSNWLRDHGFFMPKTGIRGYGHHLIAEPLSKKKLGALKLITPWDTLSHLHQEMDAQPELAPILSSEAFQQCSPWVVNRCFLHRQISVVIYLRDHLEYLPSAYTQKVHATDYCGSLSDFYRAFYRHINYLKFIRTWEKSFPGRLVVRIYDKKKLTKGNVVLDFINHGMGISDSLIHNAQLHTKDANPSLNEKIVQFKRHLNQTGEVKYYNEKKLYSALPKLNQYFPAPKVAVTSEIAKALKELNLRRDQVLAKELFNKSTLFNSGNDPIREEHPISSDEIAMMKEKLNQLLSVVRT